MSAGYRLVQWSSFKRFCDLMLMLGVLGLLGAHLGAAMLLQPAAEQISPVQLLIRAFGAAAFALLTLILAVGPLARLQPACLPLLYNRSHLGVTCCVLALVHAALVVLWYHGFGDLNPLVSLLVSNPRDDSIQSFPFESLGLVALIVLVVMAATSHDFWNANLGPAVWKAIHMCVYGAYALLVAHIMLGAVQGAKSPAYAVVVALGAGLVAALHVVAGRRERVRDRSPAAVADGWLCVGPARDIADGCASIVTPPVGERIAVFRTSDQVFAVSNVCRYQGGPLGEGRIIDGCITCPWHGFQYRPQDGTSPAPFTERIATYRTRIEHGVVFVDPVTAWLGKHLPPSVIDGADRT